MMNFCSFFSSLEHLSLECSSRSSSCRLNVKIKKRGDMTIDSQTFNEIYFLQLELEVIVIIIIIITQVLFLQTSLFTFTSGGKNITFLMLFDHHVSYFMFFFFVSCSCPQDVNAFTFQSFMS